MAPPLLAELPVKLLFVTVVGFCVEPPPLGKNMAPPCSAELFIKDMRSILTLFLLQYNPPP